MQSHRDLDPRAGAFAQSLFEQLARIAEALGTTAANLQYGGRAFAKERGLAAWALRKTFAGLRLAQIGALLGYRDHTTVCYHLRRITRKIETHPAFAARARALVPGRYLLTVRKVVVVVECEEEAAL